MDMDSSQLPGLFGNLSALVSDEVIYGVVYGGKTIDDAIREYADVLESTGFEEPEWLEEYDFNDVETLQKGVLELFGVEAQVGDWTGFGDEEPIPPDVLEQASDKLEPLAELVELTLDDPTSLDEFSDLYDDVQRAMGKISDDDVDKIMEQMDKTNDFHLIADTVFRAENAAMEDGINSTTFGGEYEIKDLLTQEANRYGGFTGGSEIGEQVITAMNVKDQTLVQATAGVTNNGKENGEENGDPAVHHPGAWKQALDFWRSLSVEDQKYISDTMNDEDLGDLKNTLDYIYGIGPEGWMSMVVTPQEMTKQGSLISGGGATAGGAAVTPIDPMDATDAIWTTFVDEARSEFRNTVPSKAASTADFHLFLGNELAEFLAEDTHDQASVASSLFQWALDRGGSGRIDESLYNTVRDVLIGNKEGWTNWQNVIDDFGEADLDPWRVPYETAEDLWISEYAGPSPTWIYPTYKEAQRGFGSQTTLTPEGDYLQAILGAGTEEEDKFDAAWARAFPNRSKLADKKLRRDVFVDATMASVMGGPSGYWDPDQEQYAGYAADDPDDVKRYAFDPFTPDDAWYDDFIKNASDHRTMLYQSAIMLADYLDRNAWEAKGEDFAKLTTYQEVAESVGVNWSNEQEKQDFMRWTYFNPLLQKAGGNEYKQAEQNIVQVGVSALTPVHAPREVRDGWKKTVQAKYDAWVGSGNNPNSFLKDLFETEGRSVGQRSTVKYGWLPPGSTRMGSMTPSGYQESFDLR